MRLAPPVAGVAKASKRKTGSSRDRSHGHIAAALHVLHVLHALAALAALHALDSLDSLSALAVPALHTLHALYRAFDLQKGQVSWVERSSVRAVAISLASSLPSL